MVLIKNELIKILNKFQRPYIYLFAIYCSSHIWILFFGNALYWDDWSLFNINQNAVLETFHMNGSLLFGYLHLSLLKIGPYIYRILTFILMFSSGLFANNIFKRNLNIDEKSIFILTILFLNLPFFGIRVTIISFPYVICYFLFFAAWFLFPKRTFLSTFLFILSFNINSLLCFYILPYLEKYCIKNKSNINLKSFLKFIRTNIFISFIPLFFYTIKLIFFKPYSIYEGYNQNFNLNNLFRSPFIQIIDFFKLKSPSLLLLFFVTTIFLYLFSKLNIFSKINYEKSICYKLLGLGIFSTFFAGFPYWILGLTPVFNSWDNRHQLLFPLGFSLIFLSFLLMLDFRLRKVFISFLLSTILLINISNYYNFHKDWIKQTTLIDQISKNKIIQNSDVIIFKDNNLEDNLYNLSYRYIDWNGIISTALNTNSKIGLNFEDYPDGLIDIFKLINANCGYLFNMHNFDMKKSIKASLVEINVIEDKEYTIIAKLISKYKPSNIELKTTEIDPNQIKKLMKQSSNINQYFCKGN